MKRSRFSEEQIIGVLKQAENGRALSELARELGVTRTTLYRWRRKYGVMEVSDARSALRGLRLQVLRASCPSVSNLTSSAKADTVQDEAQGLIREFL